MRGLHNPWPSGEALDRIIAVVGNNARFSSDARESLRSDLDWAHTWGEVGAKLRASSAKRRTKLNRLVKLAKKLKILLADDDVRQEIATASTRRVPTDEVPTSEDPETILEFLIANAEAALDEPPPTKLTQAANVRAAKELARDEMSAFEWLAGRHLPKLFKKHFGLAISGDLESPFIRFTEAALDELGIRHKERRSKHGKARAGRKDVPFTREAISRALTGARANRRRTGKMAEK